MIQNLLSIFLMLLYIIPWIKSHYPEVPCDGVYKPKECENATSESLVTVEEFDRCAPTKLHPLVRDYVWGASGRQITLRENVDAYKRIRIRKRVLRDISNKNLATTVLKQKISFPVAISPTAGQSFCHPDGDIATAKGAWRMGTIMVLSSYANTALETVAASVPLGTNLWMQTYIIPNKTEVVQLVRRAEKAGYKAIVVTVDEATETVLRCNVNTRFLEKLSLLKGLPNLGDPNEWVIDPHLTFRDVEWLKRLTKLPIIVKGIMTGEDAVSAIKAGASAIFVSNHGGRQLDGALPTIEALPEIVDAVNARYPGTEVYVDGGIRNGFDVFKAIAVGATAVFIGRANLWGLTMGGAKGVEKVLTILKNEFEEAMLHAGFNNPKEITRDSIILPQSCNICNPVDDSKEEYYFL